MLTIPAIGTTATCYHGELGTVVSIYAYSGDIELSMDESHADVYRGHFCYTLALAPFHPSLSVISL